VQAEALEHGEDEGTESDACESSERFGTVPEAIRPAWTTVCLVRKWSQTSWAWTRMRLQRFRKSESGPSFEETLCRFASVLENAESVELVENALVRQVSLMLPDCQIEILRPGDAAASLELEQSALGAGENDGRLLRRWKGCRGSSLLDVRLSCGAIDYGCLRILPSPRGRSALTGDVAARLNTICMLARLALRACHRNSDWCGHDDEPEVDRSSAADATSHTTVNAPGRVRTTVLHDATFLYAVLPFALAQSRRHREPLSLICVEIDRLSGVQDLFGREAAASMVRGVGDLVARMIRRSDVVGRLDDDRIVAVLPRSTGEGALQLAQNICRSVAEHCRAGCDEPSLGATVSIGVATFPTCAHDLYSLFDAADEALVRAQNQGRDQAVLAPARRGPQSRAVFDPA
jgi:diguanylate cyclase (GGDEF)-like protein